MSGDKTQDETRVLYNAECPVCSFEIDHYRKRADRDGLPLSFDDLNTTELSRWGVDAEAAARRLHVLQDGKVLSGMPAFRALWSEMPRMRWLAWLTGLPGLRQMLSVLYDRVLAPILYRAHLRRVARRKDD